MYLIILIDFETELDKNTNIKEFKNYFLVLIKNKFI